jgi:hypothetical protein
LSLTLSESNGRALFVQIRNHVVIARGLLVAGMRLTPVLSLARQLAIE